MNLIDKFIFIVGPGGGGFDTSMTGQGSGVVAESKPEVVKNFY